MVKLRTSLCSGLLFGVEVFFCHNLLFGKLLFGTLKFCLLALAAVQHGTVVEILLSKFQSGKVALATVLYSGAQLGALAIS